MEDSRNEAILQSIIDGTAYTAEPQSRIEDLLLQLKQLIEEGGGGGETANYDSLINKPKINNVELKGNKTLNDLGISHTKIRVNGESIIITEE